MATNLVEPDHLTRLPPFRIVRVGVIGPGLPDWPTTRAILAGDQPWTLQPTVITLPPILPPAERRRTSLAVRLALACGHEAIVDSPWPAASLATVFSSSGGDGMTCHQICETLASDDRRVSPTQFHNSVHNAPAGYWSIAMQAPVTSTSLCAHDASFSAGLLEAVSQVAARREPVLLLAYDAPYPAPLHALRPIPHAFGLALLLAPADAAAPGDPPALRPPALRLGFTGRDATPAPTAALESLRQQIPTARALPLLQALALPALLAAPGGIVLDDQPAIGDEQPARRLLLLAETGTAP